MTENGPKMIKKWNGNGPKMHQGNKENSKKISKK